MEGGGRLLLLALAALFALWFTVFTAEPGRVHSCPMHDGGSVAVTFGLSGIW